MTGAAVTNVVLLDISPAVPIASCVASGVVAYVRRNDLRILVDTITI